MQDFWNVVLKILEYAAAIGAGLAAINRWAIQPLRELMNRQREKLDSIEKAVNTARDDISDILGDRLMQSYERYKEQGWCSVEDKKQFIELHTRYTERGHNHLANWLEDELMKLPDHPE